jgi:shikimate dehydrogenase
MKKLGLLGKNISYSFSKKHFTEKFIASKIESEYSYENFDIENITQFKDILQKNPNLIGLNVTIPYKETIIPFLDDCSKEAREIGAVNTLKITKNKTVVGYNTDYYGFLKSLQKTLKPNHKKAIILGTGGAAKAVAYALKQIEIPTVYVSSSAKPNSISYQDLNQTLFNKYQIIINCTPIGTFPSVENFPPIPYHLINNTHFAFDLIYNPTQTQFLQKAAKQGADIQNGYDMLVFQAEKSWEIWNE